MKCQGKEPLEFQEGPFGGYVMAGQFCQNDLELAEFFVGGMADELAFYGPKYMLLSASSGGDRAMFAIIVKDYKVFFKNNELTFCKGDTQYVYELQGDFSQFDVKKDLVYLFAYAVYQEYFTEQEHIDQFTKFKEEKLAERNARLKAMKYEFSEADKARYGKLAYDYFFSYGSLRYAWRVWLNCKYMAVYNPLSLAVVHDAATKLKVLGFGCFLFAFGLPNIVYLCLGLVC